MKTFSVKVISYFSCGFYFSLFIKGSFAFHYLSSAQLVVITPEVKLCQSGQSVDNSNPTSDGFTLNYDMRA